MFDIFEIILWSSILIMVYCYFIYPLFVKTLSKIRNRPVEKGNAEPFVSIVISAYNEAKVIQKTLENKLGLKYPQNKIEIIIVSDGSDDGTDEIINRNLRPNVTFIRQEPRQGKSAALNRAVLQAKGDIICFADANSIWDENALAYIVQNYADSTVGYVTGKMVYTSSTGNIAGDGCSLYMKYENKLREFETQIGSIVGVDGGIDAIRKELYQTINPSLLPDLILPLKVIGKGSRVVYEPQAILKEESLDSTQDEFRMRIRVSLRAFHALWHMKLLLNPFKYGLFSWQLFSHKWLRYFIWLFLLSALISNIILFNCCLLYNLLLCAQTLFYVFVILGYILEILKIKSGKILTFPYYFLILNLSSAVAFTKFLKGQNTITWQPRKG